MFPSSLSQSPELRFRALVLLLLAGCVLLAWTLRFVQDDAFISFRYAENFANGKGLVWNEGERVEGYSNFLWTLLMAAGMRIGIDPVTWSQTLGIVFFAVALCVSWKVASLLLPSRGAVVLFVVLLGANYTFLSFATGGLETSLQTALVLSLAWGVLQAVRSSPPSLRSIVVIGLCGSAAILTRVDSVVFCLPLEGVLALSLLRNHRSGIRPLLILAALHIAVLGPWILWKGWYYGEFFPNTYYLKASSTFFTHIGYGLRYLWTFLSSYWMIPVIVVALLGLVRGRREQKRGTFLFGTAVLLWAAYLVAIGGDFMEFRMIVPALPLLLLVVTAGLWQLQRTGVIPAACALVLVAGSLHHALTFTYDLAEGIEPVPQLAGHLTREDEHWIQIGKTLDSLFGPRHGVRIATTAAGAIPFYSKLPTVDMLGVNDPWVARHGFAASQIPGHQRITPISYLLRKHVNLVFSHPMVLPIDEPVRHTLYVPIDLEGDIVTVRVVELPLDAGHKVVAWYLSPDSTVDAVKRKCNWREYKMAMR